MRRSPWPQSQLPSFLTSNSLGELNPQPACLQLRQQPGAPSLCLASPPGRESAGGLCPRCLALCCLPGCSVLALSVSQAGLFLASTPLSTSPTPVKSLKVSFFPLPVALGFGYSAHFAVTLLAGPSFMFRVEYSQHTFASHSQIQHTCLFFTKGNLQWVIQGLGR